MSGHSAAPDPPCPAKRATGRKPTKERDDLCPKILPCPGVPWVTDPSPIRKSPLPNWSLSGTMTDRRAAEAVGLNPETAASTKAKHLVRAYMLEHRAAVREKLVDPGSGPVPACRDGLRKSNLGRDQILTRLWELATLSHEATRGTIAGQIKALSMIVAIEGLIPSGKMNDRRLSSVTQPAAPPVKADIDLAAWFPRTAAPSRRCGTRQSCRHRNAQPAAPQAPAPQTPAPEPPPPLHSMFEPSQPSVCQSLHHPRNPDRVPAAIGSIFDADLHPAAFLGLSFSPKAPLARPPQKALKGRIYRIL